MRNLLLSLGAAGLIGLCGSTGQAEPTQSKDDGYRGGSIRLLGTADGNAQIEQVGRRGGRRYSYRPYYGSSRSYYSYPRYGYSPYGPSYGAGPYSYRAYYGAPSYYGGYRSYGYQPYGGYGYGYGNYGRGYSGRGGVSIGIGF